MNTTIKPIHILLFVLALILLNSMMTAITRMELNGQIRSGNCEEVQITIRVTKETSKQHMPRNYMTIRNHRFVYRAGNSSNTTQSFLNCNSGLAPIGDNHE